MYKMYKLYNTEIIVYAQPYRLICPHRNAQRCIVVYKKEILHFDLGIFNSKKIILEL